MYLTNTLKCKLIKIPSGEINNFVMLRHVKLNKEKLIISTGMSTIKEIAETLNYISKKKIFKTFNNNVKIIDKKSHNFLKSRVLLMHCVTDYPVLDKFANLSAIKNFIEKFNLHVGYSDHTQDILAPIISASYGAKYIEKHLTLDQNDNGPDHRASIEPDLFKQMVVNLRKFENMKGNGIKKVEQCEQKNILIARKSLIAKKNIKKGDKFSYKNITAKRPGNGVSVSKIDKYLGKRAKKDYFTDDFIWDIKIKNLRND